MRCEGKPGDPVFAVACNHPEDGSLIFEAHVYASRKEAEARLVEKQATQGKEPGALPNFVLEGRVGTDYRPDFPGYRRRLPGDPA